MTADLLMPPAPMQVHRTVNENGDTYYFESDDGKPEYAPINTPAPELTPQTHYLLPDGDGGVEYGSFTDDSANPAPQLAPAATHWFDRDSQGELHYVKSSNYDTSAPATADTLTRPGRPPLACTDHDRTQGTLFIAALWPCILAAGGPRPAHLAHHHFPNTYHPRELATLELPSRTHIPNGQRVTLAAEGFDRYPDHTATRDAYAEDPRTWIFEEADAHIPWLNAAAAHLTALTQGPHEVIAAVYDSITTDRPSSPHWDAWYSAIVQFDGAKQWSIGPDAHQVTTRPGDVLLIPEGLTHAVTTPTEPGHSRHLVFDIGIHLLHAPTV